MLDSPPTTGSGRAEAPLLRLAGAASLLVGAGIHVYEFFPQSLAYLAALFVASAAGMVVGAALLVGRAPRLGWLVGGITAALTVAGYVWSRAVGLPLDAGDVGNWLQADGVASLVVELLAVGCAVLALVDRHRLSWFHASQELQTMRPGWQA
ncbi:MAG TPA: hypothetical protein VE152_01990 [Acidimicrobiales bacterium]|jgi:hypothetical protein|nr:hypothetical protein [Acidimicrobiales bacterium]